MREIERDGTHLRIALKVKVSQVGVLLQMGEVSIAELNATALAYHQ